MEDDAGIGQPAAHPGVALPRRRLVIVVGVHRLHVQGLRQTGDLFRRAPVQHDEPRMRDTVARAQRPQLLVELAHTGVDELDPPVPAWQRLQDVGVEHEDAPHPPRGAQGVVERGVVVRPQIAAEPHQGAVEFLVHCRAS